MGNKGKIVTGKSKLVNLFNSHYVTIVVKISGCPPEIEGNPKHKTNDITTVPSIIRKNQTHPSILKIKRTLLRTHLIFQLQLQGK